MIRLLMTATLAALLPCQDREAELDKKLQKARQNAAAKLLPVIKQCEKDQLGAEGKELLARLLAILPDEKEAKAISDRGALEKDADDAHAKSRPKTLGEYRKKAKAAFVDILKGYETVAAAALKTRLTDRVEAVYAECDKLCEGAALLDPVAPGKPATIKGMDGPFTQLQARCGIVIFTNLDPAEQADVIRAADDTYDSFCQFFEPYVKGIGQKKLPAMTMYYFKTREELEKYCGLNGVHVASVYGFAMGTNSYFRIDRDLFGLTDIILHEGTHQLDELLLGKSTSRASHWIVEALACYFESVERKGLRIQFAKRVDVWELKGPTKFFDLDRYCDLNQSAWDAEITSSGNYNLVYGQAATLFRFFMQAEDGKYRERFINEVIIGGKSSSKQLCQVFGFKQLKEIEKAYKEFANTIYAKKID